jgi:hypothetical protein
MLALLEAKHHLGFDGRGQTSSPRFGGTGNMAKVYLARVHFLTWMVS